MWAEYSAEGNAEFGDFVDLDNNGEGYVRMSRSDLEALSGDKGAV